MKEDGMVVDANVMDEYFKGAPEERGEVYDLVSKILESTGIAICKIIEYEYEKRTNKQFFRIWEKEQLKNGHICIMGKHSLHRDIEKEIHNKYGLPKSTKAENSKDIHYIRIANETQIKYIVTKDIDFFDPKKKMDRNKEKIKRDRSGALNKFLKKKLKIIVGHPTYHKSEIEALLTRI